MAVALSRYPNIRVDVYEAAGQFKEIGAGVMIWARTWKILSSLGMEEEFSRIAHAPPDSKPGAYIVLVYAYYLTASNNGLS